MVQIDDAFLASYYDVMVPPLSLEDYRRSAALRVDVLNHALRGIPAERSRYHVCWGSWNGPHTNNVPLKEIVDLILRVNVGDYSLEMANPLHEHEWRVWETVKLPEGKVLLPGVISHATNVVEHPELVAERLTRLARLVGNENVIASTDCRFAQGPFGRRVHPSMMWAKLRALSEGAAIAGRTLAASVRLTLLITGARRIMPRKLVCVLLDGRYWAGHRASALRMRVMRGSPLASPTCRPRRSRRTCMCVEPSRHGVSPYGAGDGSLLLFQDGSTHRWIGALEHDHDLIVTLDHATNWIDSAMPTCGRASCRRSTPASARTRRSLAVHLWPTPVSHWTTCCASNSIARSGATTACRCLADRCKSRAAASPPLRQGNGAGA
jgi:hypothetical protein